MNNPYIDHLGLWNVKECVDGIPSGNDGWILTFYAKKLGLPVNMFLIMKSYLSLEGQPIPKERRPGKKTPPPSRDVMLGLVGLKLITPEMMEERDWNFSPYPLPRFNPFKLITQLWRLRGKHRNHMWQNPGFEQVFHLAFMVPFQDRAFYYESWDKKAPWYYRLIAWVDKTLVRTSSDSSRLIRWMKYDIDPGVEVFERVFGKEHPLTDAYILHLLNHDKSAQG